MAAPISLDTIRISRPCPADWDGMAGDDRVRFCGTCRQNVYDLTAMPRTDAEALIREREGRLCARLYQRPDGRVTAADCFAILRGRPKYLWPVLGALMVMVFALGLVFGSRPDDGAGRGGGLWQMEPFATVMGWINPRPVTTPFKTTMGAL